MIVSGDSLIVPLTLVSCGCGVVQAVLLLLKSLVHVLRGGLASHLDVVMDDLKRCLQDKNQVPHTSTLSAHPVTEAIRAPCCHHIIWLAHIL